MKIASMLLHQVEIHAFSCRVGKELINYLYKNILYWYFVHPSYSFDVTQRCSLFCPSISMNKIVEKLEIEVYTNRITCIVDHVLYLFKKT